ncbi:hypothetical protein [Actinoplanes cyaneus]|nr:hypothetical protein [Actinoplanes cyaneus]
MTILLLPVGAGRRSCCSSAVEVPASERKRRCRTPARITMGLGPGPDFF